MMDGKQLDSVKYTIYFSYLSSVINYIKYILETKCRSATAKAMFKRKKTFHQKTGFKEETGEVLNLEN